MRKIKKIITTGFVLSFLINAIALSGRAGAVKLIYLPPTTHQVQK